MEKVRGVNGEKWDAEWELKKAQNRFYDVMDEIAQLRTKIKSIEGKIYRLQQQVKGEKEEELEEEEEGIPPLEPRAPTEAELKAYLEKQAMEKYYVLDV